MRGFSLLEVIILTTVGMLAGGLLIAILVNNTGVVYQQTSRVSQGLNINDTLIQFRTLVKESAAVVSEYPEGSQTPDYKSSADQLVVKMNVLSSSGSIVANAFDYAVFFKEADIIRYKVFADLQSVRGNENMVLATGVYSIVFDYLDTNGQTISPPALAEKVKATIILQQKAGYGVETNIATSEASLRND